MPPRSVVAGWSLAAVAAGLAAVGWFALSTPARWATSFVVPWEVLGLGVAATWLLAVSFETRHQSLALSLSEVPLLVGLVFTPVDGLLAARVVATGVVFALYKRQAPHKAAFNVANVALDTVVAIHVYHAVLGDHSPVSRLGWVAAAAALFASQAVTFVALAAVFGASAGRNEIRRVAGMVPAAALVTLIDTCLALVAVFVLWVDPLGGVLLGAICILLGVGYRAYQSLRRRQSVLERIHDFTQAVDGHDQPDAVLRATLDAARETMAARSAELWLHEPTGWLHYRSDDGGISVEPILVPDPLERVALAGGHGVLVPRGRRSDELTSLDLAERGVGDAITVPFHGDLEGALTVCDRLNGLTFVPDDLRALTSMTAHANVALHSASLLDRLAREVEDREHQALHDALTGLPNRTMFNARVEEMLALRGRVDAAPLVAVILLDLDRFKEVNDTLGHGVGDVVLRVTASRLRAEVARRGMVARLGGDEFAVVFEARSVDEAVHAAEGVRRSIEQPVEEEGLIIESRVSIGLAVAPVHGDGAATLLRLADVAMYAAKEKHGGVMVYEARYDHYSPRRLTLAGELRQALAAGEITLAYQPQQSLQTGAVTAVEALARWNHRQHGMVPPDEFIPVAEQSGLMVRLTDHVLTEALAQQSRWREHGIDLAMAVNLSPRVVQDGHLPALVAERLRQAGVPADRLTLELTETGLVTDPARVTSVLHQLAATGVRISIDDFGTGYSSLSRLSDLPVAEVKIDKSFVFAMAGGGTETVVRSIVDLGHNLNLRVVAEGVEDPSTVERLRRLRCDAIQGHVLSRPVAGALLETWLGDRPVAAASRVIVPLRKPRLPG